jgi:hypothetical protein
MQKPGDLPGRRFAAFERPRKGVQAAMGIRFSEKIPSPACRIRVAERSTGFCLFSLTRVLRRKEFLCERAEKDQAGGCISSRSL